MKYLIIFLMSTFCYADIVSAKKARLLSDKNATQKQKECYNDWIKYIGAVIQDATDVGDYYTGLNRLSCLTNNQLGRSQSYLSKLGYKVDNSMMDQNTFIINWAQ